MRQSPPKTTEFVHIRPGTGLVHSGAVRLGGSSGFTFIELLIVVALVAVLAGISAPTVAAGMERYEILSAGQQIVSTIRTARLQAVSKNMVLRVRFNFPADGQYQIVDADDAAVGQVLSLNDDITFGADIDDVEFTTSGRLNDVAAVSVVVTNGHEEFDRTVTVSTSGQVRLE